MKVHDHWIGGSPVPPAHDARIERFSPTDGTPIAVAAQGTAADVDAAVAAARKAFDAGPWAQIAGQERAKVLNRLADLMASRHQEIAMLEAEEAGKPIAAARAEVEYGIDLTRYAAAQAWDLSGRLLSDSGPDGLGLVLNQPRGVAGLIVPWNYPVVCLMQKLPNALAAGCAMVVKPSELTAGTTLAIARLAEEAGVPAGQVNVVIGTGDVVGEALTSHPDVDMISFTGSSRVGRIIARKCAEALKHCSLELGGKGANIVFADCDLDAAVEGAFLGFTINKGEECCAGGRILVERSIEKEFTDRLIARCESARVGRPMDEETEIGPLIHEQHLDRVMGYIAKGRDEGACLLTGGERATGENLDNGWFVPPTLFAGVTSEMTIFREEIFGPVACIVTFDSLNEAVELANDTSYGLANGVWTSNLDKAIAVTRRVRSGMVYVNTYLETIPQLPFGGMKESGIGRENGAEGLQEFLETRAAYIRLKSTF